MLRTVLGDPILLSRAFSELGPVRPGQDANPRPAPSRCTGWRNSCSVSSSRVRSSTTTATEVHPHADRSAPDEADDRDKLARHAELARPRGTVQSRQVPL